MNLLLLLSVASVISYKKKIVMPLFMMIANKFMCLTYSALSIRVVLTLLPFKLVRMTTAKAYLHFFILQKFLSLFWLTRLRSV